MRKGVDTAVLDTMLLVWYPSLPHTPLSREGSMLLWATWRRITGSGTCTTQSRAVIGWETRTLFTI